jgi:hypothetical protein
VSDQPGVTLLITKNAKQKAKNERTLSGPKQSNRRGAIEKRKGLIQFHGKDSSKTNESQDTKGLESVCTQLTLAPFSTGFAGEKGRGSGGRIEWRKLAPKAQYRLR